MGDLIAELTEYGRHLQREIDEVEIRELRIQVEEALTRVEKERAEKEEERARAEKERARIRDYESKILLLEKENAELKAKLASPIMITGEETR